MKTNKSKYCILFTSIFMSIISNSYAANNNDDYENYNKVLHIFVTQGTWGGAFKSLSADDLCGSDPLAPKEAKNMKWEFATDVSNVFFPGYEYVYTNDNNSFTILSKELVTPDIMTNEAAQKLLYETLYEAEFNSSGEIDIWGSFWGGNKITFAGDCLKWTSSSSGQSNNFGGNILWKPSGFNMNGSLCSKAKRLFCVQQPTE